MEEKKVLSDEELNNASGGLQIVYDNKCPKCHSVAYILVMMEAGDGACSEQLDGQDRAA